MKASALIVTDENMTDITIAAKEICNKHQLPVIFIKKETPYALLIAQIMEFRISFEERQSLNSKIALILNSNISPKEKIRLINEVNPYFSQYVTCFFCAEDDELFSPSTFLNESNNSLLNVFNRNPLNFATTYRNGILVIISYKETSDFNLSNIIDSTISVIRKYRPNVQIGISSSCLTSNLGLAISQCYTAYLSKNLNSDMVSYYKDIGVSRILVELNGSETLESFYSDMTQPLLDYDSRKNTMLLDTLLSFVNNDMDFKKTSKALFVHENTIRYRLNLIKDLIPYGSSEIDFLETLSIVSKIHKIKEL